MKTGFKIIIITLAFAAFIVCSYHIIKQIERWVNKPSDKEMREQYKKVGY